MHFSRLSDAIKDSAIRTAKGPVAILIVEDEVEVAATIQHHLEKGFKSIVLASPPELELSSSDQANVIRIDFPTRKPDATVEIVNAINKALPEKTWLYYGYNAEFLFYPFSETRSVGELLAFHAEERRFAMLTYVVDVYAGDLVQTDNEV